MPTGRPDYWYGTALYFEQTPTDGETARGPTSNWAYDHRADANAHHVPVVAGDIDHYDIANVTAAQHHAVYDEEAMLAMSLGKAASQPASATFYFFSYDNVSYTFYFKRDSGWNGDFTFFQSGTNPIIFKLGGVERLRLLTGGGLTGCWDDTPSNGQQNKGVTSDWAFDHKANASIHHSKYLNSDAISAMGAKGDANALHHDRYTDALALTQAQSIIDDTPADGDTAHSPSSNWAFDHKANANAHHTPPSVFVDRGDPTDFDWEIGDVTADGTWRDLNLDGVVPAGAIVVLFSAYVQDNAAGTTMWLRKKGNNDVYNRSAINTQVGGVVQFLDVICPCDSNREVQYNIEAGMDAIGLVIKGWWI